MAKIRIKLDKYEIEIEDQEKKIDELLTIAKNEIRTIISEEGKTLKEEKSTPKEEKQQKSGDKGIEQYPNVYSISEDKLSVICQLDTDTKAEGIRILTKLYLYGKYLMGEEGPVKTNEKKEICKSHGVHDESNFMKHLKKEKRAFQITGKRGNYKITLTVPGKEDAKKLAEKYNNKKDEQ